MNLNISFIESDLLINKDYITVLEVENKKLFYRLVSVLNGYANDNGEEEIFDDKITMKVVIDYFNLDYNSKKQISVISKLINSNIDEQNVLELNKYYRKLLNIYEKILKDTDIPLAFDENINLDNLIKILNLKVVYENDVLKNLLIMIDIIKNLNEQMVVVFINLKQYLSKDELLELYKYAIYNEIYLIMVDSQSYGATIKYEKKLIIDDNFEEFML